MIIVLTAITLTLSGKIVDHMYPEFLEASTKKKAGTPFSRSTCLVC